MNDVTQTVDVHTPVTTAYNQWTQFESFPEFMNGVVSVRQLDDRHTHWVTRVGGVHREFDAEITEQRPDELIAWRSIDGDVAHAGRVTFDRLAADETRVTVNLSWQPDNLTEKAGSLLGLDDRQVKSDVERFKEFIENRGVETGAWRGEVPGSNRATGMSEATGMSDSNGSYGSATTNGMAGATGAAPGARVYGTPDANQTVPNQGTPNPAVPNQSAQGGHHPDVIDLLRQQHEQIMAQFEQVRLASGAAKQQQFDHLATMLTKHEAGEQTVLHPATRAETHGEEVAAATVREESHAARELAVLREIGVTHPEFDIRFEQFHRDVLAHASHEENEEFPRLRQSLPPERLDELGATLVSVQSR